MSDGMDNPVVTILGGHLVDPAAGVDAPADLRIENGRIARVTAPGALPREGQVIDAAGRHVLPGLIDTHAHLREPGHEHKGTVADAAFQAAMGGITCLFAMPNTDPVCDSRAVCEMVINRARQTGAVRVLPVGAMTRGMENRVLSEMGELAACGCPALADAWAPIESSQMFRRALEYARGVGLPVITVPQDLGLSADGVMHEGDVATRLGLAGIPAASEEISVARAIALAELAGCRLHIAPITTAGSVRLVADARRRGLDVSAGTAPHYLHLTDAALIGYATAAKVYPPLRPRTDLEALRAAVADGTVSVLSSCHAPHADYEKAVEFSLAPFGMAGLSTALSLTLLLVKEGVLPLSSAVARWTHGPREVFALADAGTLAEGSPADLTIVDLSSTWEITPRAVAGHGLSTPWLGQTLPGRVCQTLLGGKIVHDSQRSTAVPPHHPEDAVHHA
ncbi:MAG: dihydroorotase [Nitrospirota bacterium]|nr:dihydroorotase [Nitrospirota bacterium]